MSRTATLTQRVYYEDTDCSGRVYHASYLKFMERGRTEFLRECDLTHNVMEHVMGEPCFFAVHKMDITFKAPAVLDDEIMIQTRTKDLSGTTLALNQTITPAQDVTKVLVLASVNIVLIKKSGRPMRFNKKLIQYFQ